MSENIYIRRTSETDGEILREIRLSALRDAPYAFGATLEEAESKPQSDYNADAERHSKSDRSTSFLALQNDKPVGMSGAFFEQQSHRPFICSVWVTPSMRGTKLATDIVKKTISWLKDQGAHQIYIWVADDNTRAISFYKRIGFSKTNEVQALPSNMNQSESLYLYVIGTS